MRGAALTRGILLLAVVILGMLHYSDTVRLWLGPHGMLRQIADTEVDWQVWGLSSLLGLGGATLGAQAVNFSASAFVDVITNGFIELVLHRIWSCSCYVMSLASAQTSSVCAYVSFTSAQMLRGNSAPASAPATVVMGYAVPAPGEQEVQTVSPTLDPSQASVPSAPPAYAVAEVADAAHQYDVHALAQLQQLSVSELRKRAAKEGCSDAEINAARMTDRPKRSLAQLIANFNAENEIRLSTVQAAAAARLAALEQRYHTTFVKDLVAEAKRLPSIEDATVERVLETDEPRAGLIQMLMAVALVEAARSSASRDQELHAGTRISLPGHGVGTYVAFRSKWFGANEHVIDFDDGNRRQVVKLAHYDSLGWDVTDGILTMSSARLAQQAAKRRERWKYFQIARKPQSRRKNDKQMDGSDVVVFLVIAAPFAAVIFAIVAAIADGLPILVITIFVVAGVC